MNPLLASLVYACGIAGLFYLDRDESIKTSKALWLPVLYLWVIGSRPVSFWLGVGPAYRTNTGLEGSPVDAAFFVVLLTTAICVLVHRGRRILTFLNSNGPILIYFLFCLVSILWSDFPGVAFKRWIKAIGDLAMILIVITDEQPVAALGRLFSRTGFILLPLSLLFIKYFPYLGRSYDLWTGFPMNTGLTNDKNMLGVVTFVLSLGAVWRVLALLRSDEELSNRGRHLLAQATLIVFGGLLLIDANSATSTVAFIIGAGVLLTTSLRFVRRHTATVHVIVLSLIVTAGLVILVGGPAGVAATLGRKPTTGGTDTFTGRTDIWAALIPMAPNPLVGAGFESFWLNPRVAERLAVRFPNLPLNEAHDGYIEVYLELGWVGLALIGVILIDGYRRSVKAFRRDPALGALLIAFILSAVVYSITEAGFRMMDPIWIFLLLAIIGASSIAAGVGVGASRPLYAFHDRSPELPARSALATRPSGRARTGKSCDDEQLDLTQVYRRGGGQNRNPMP